MKPIFAASLLMGLTVLSPAAPAAPAGAQVTIRAPGVAIQAGPQPVPADPYWRRHREEEREGRWERRSDFREAEHRRMDWQREHCVRDWNGREFCRR